MTSPMPHAGSTGDTGRRPDSDAFLVLGEVVLAGNHSPAHATRQLAGEEVIATVR